MSDCGVWTEVSPNRRPVGLYFHQLVYDAARDRLVVYGGLTPNSYINGSVWALNRGGTPAWSRIATTGNPDSTWDAAVILDPTRNRMIVFGGNNQELGVSNRLWALDLVTSTWSPLDVPNPPSARAGARAIYDAPRDRMILFGGADFDGIHNDTWSLSFSGTPTWTQLTPAGIAPFARAAHTAIFDAPRNRMIVFGGYSTDPLNPNAPVLNDVWSLSLTPGETWTELLPSGTAPLPRSSHSAIFDAGRNRMIVTGGATSTPTSAEDAADVWSLAFTGPLRWTRLTPTGTGTDRVHGHAMVYDDGRQQLVSVGGLGASLSETWTLNMSGSPAWAEILPAGQLPPGRSDHTTVYDPVAHRMLIYGGVSEAGFGLHDTWSFDLTTSAWTHVAAAGTAPTRFYQAAAFDSANNRLVVFSGYDDSPHLHGETFALSFSGTPTWTQLSPSGTPPQPRTDACAIYDPTRNRIVVQGGLDSTYASLDDVSALSLSGGTAWTPLSPTGPAIATSDHAAIYDRRRDRMIIVAGYDDHSGPLSRQLSFAGSGTWSPLGDDANAPGQYGLSVALDPARDRMIALSAEYEVEALSLAPPERWSVIGTDPTLEQPYYGGAIFDADHDRVLRFGGIVVNGTNGVTNNDVQALTFPAGFVSLDAHSFPAPGGDVSRDPAASCYPSGAVVTLTPVAAPGFSFTGWSGDVTGTQVPLTVTLGSNKVVVANFHQPPPVCGEWRRLLLDTGTLPVLETVVIDDPTRHRLLAVGPSFGSYPQGILVWELPLGTDADWRLVPIPGTVPSIRYDFNVALDPIRDRLILAGGYWIGPADDVWALPLGGTMVWSQIVAPGTAGGTFSFASLTYDPVRDRMLRFGGRPYDAYAPGQLMNELWALSLGPTPAWSLLAPVGPLPPARADHAAVYDPVRDRLLVFGGTDDAVALADLWSVDLAGTPTWSRLQPFGNAPAGRAGAGAIYDPIRDRMLVYGGATTGGGGLYPYPPYLDDVFGISLHPAPAWQPLAPGGTPFVGRYRPGTAYDSEGDRLVVAGGSVYNEDYLAPPTHALSCAGGYWLQTASTRPDLGDVTRSPARDCYAAGAAVSVSAVATTPSAGFAGWIGDATGLSNPLELTMSSNLTILARFDVVVATLIADFSAERSGPAVVLHWTYAAGARVDGWHLERATTAVGPWQPVPVTSTDDAGTIRATDASVDDGEAYWYRLEVRTPDGATTRFGPIAVAAGGAPITISDVAGLTNPARTPLRIDLASARAGLVSVSVLDVMGRECIVLSEGARPAGRFSLTWDGRSGSAPLAPGVYLVRFRAPDRVVTRRFVLLR